MESESFIGFIRSGGAAMYLLLLLGGLGVAGTGVLVPLGLFLKGRAGVVAAAVLLVLGALALGVTGLGYAMNLRAVEAAVMHVSPQDKELILAAGRSEALSVPVLGLWVALLPLCGGLFLLGPGLQRANQKPLFTGLGPVTLVLSALLALGLGAAALRLGDERAALRLQAFSGDRGPE